MRGGFVACFGASPAPADAERAAGAMRWHTGSPQEHGFGPLRLLAFQDAQHGPFVAQVAGRPTLVHGATPRPLEELVATGRRFAVVELDGDVVRAARDPLGLCPLFYRELDGVLWLATEIAPLVALGSASPDLAALAAQAALVPDDASTGFSGVYRVLPGFVLEARLGPPAEQRRYWRVERILGAYRGTRDAAEAELRTRFCTAVERTAEEGAAVLLSGGIDSSAVAAVAARPGRSLSLVHVRFGGFGDAAEEAHARRVAEAAGLALDVLSPELEPWNPAAELETSIVPYLSPPAFAADPALAAARAGGASVGLDGNDGDGVLGYVGREWGELLLRGSFGRLRQLAQSHGWRPVVHGVLDDVVPPSLRLRGLRRREPPPPTFLQLAMRYFAAPLHERMRAVDHEDWQSPRGEWRARQLRQVMPVTTIRNEEHELRGARHGVDLRHPFADRDLVELLVSLPASIKSNPFQSKDLFRTALAPVVPEAIIARRDKPEYRSVFAQLIRAEACIEMIRESRVSLPLVDYARLYRDAEVGAVPIGLLMFLARAHVFAARNG